MSEGEEGSVCVARVQLVCVCRGRGSACVCVYGDRACVWGEGGVVCV